MFFQGYERNNHISSFVSWLNQWRRREIAIPSSSSTNRIVSLCGERLETLSAVALRVYGF